MLLEQRDGMLAVMAIDLDDFKQVNDSLGHPAGDALLRQVAMRLAVCLGGRGVVARLGRDQFVLLVPLPMRRLRPISRRPVLAPCCSPFASARMLRPLAQDRHCAHPAGRAGLRNRAQQCQCRTYQVKAQHGGAYRFF